MTAANPKPELSAIVVFSDCEDSIGRRVGALIDKLRGSGRDFELLAINDGSRDNTVAVLSLLAQRFPELRVIAHDVADRAFAQGALAARADLLLLIACPIDAPATTSAAALPCLAPLGWALSRVSSRSDAVVVRGSFAVARRASVMPLLARVGGSAAAFDRDLAHAARRVPGLRLDVVGAQKPVGLFASLARAVAGPLRHLPFTAGVRGALGALGSSAR